MSHAAEITLHRGGEPEPLEQHPPGEHHANVFAVLHRMLRGRYLLVGVVGVVLAGTGGVLGWLSTVPKFRADALIRVQPVLPRVIFETEQTTMLPMFQSFVATQASLLQHGRVLSRAFDSEAWRGLGRDRSPESEATFKDGLKVQTSREAPELIVVAYTDEDRRAAMIAVQEIVGAYQELFGGSETRGVRDMTVNTLSTRRQLLEGQRRDLENKIRGNAAEFETTDLATLETHYLTQLLQLDDKVSELETRLVEMNVDPSTYQPPGDRASAVSPEPKPFTPKVAEEIARLDRLMGEYFAGRQKVQQELARLRARGLGEKSPTIQRAQNELQAIDELIAARADEWNREQANPTVPGLAAAIAGPGTREETIPEMVGRFVRLKQQADVWRQRTALISRKRVENESLRREIENVQTALDQTDRRLDEINVESKVQDRVGRIEVILPESPPAMPNVDSRFRNAAGGTFLGLGMTFGLAMLLGLVDRRARYSDQAAPNLLNVPMLGILPELPAEPDDPEEVAAAVHCVHQIRTLLQLPGVNRKIYAVTSPTAGDGKTSLAMSLGLSFAATGRSTLLVDFDLIGRGLSSRFKVTPVRGLGRALIEGHSPVVEPTGVSGLSIIAAGTDEAPLVGRLNGDRFDRLLEDLRGRFDVIIIDTGPILGSLEANIAVARTDGVVLVVGRGQKQDLIKAACNHIRALSARLIGLVFNRARSADVRRSTASASVRSLGWPEQPRAPRSAERKAAIAHLDPIARSVAVDVEH